MTTPNLVDDSAVDLLRLMHERDVSPVEVVSAFLTRIDQINPAINAVVTIRTEESLAEARLAEKAISRGECRRLEGLPITVKDTIETAGIRTTAGSKSLASHVPNRDAPAVDKLRAHGAIVLGKTNAPEFAMTYATDNALFGRTLNPLNPEVTPGGSSGGEAAIIAAHGSPLGLGSDLGGSIRIPANFCGIAGLRPTIGRVADQGHIPTLPDPFDSISVIGPMAKNVEDIDFVMRSLCTDWRAARDRTYGEPVPTPAIAYYVADGINPTHPSTKSLVLSMVGHLTDANFVTQEVLPPAMSELYSLWDELWIGLGGAQGLLSRYISQLDDCSSPLTRLLQISPDHPSPQRVDRAKRRLAEIRSDVMRFMDTWPIVVCPVASGPPTSRSGQWSIDGVELRGSAGFGYSYVWSLLGFPALAVPIEMGPGMGLQIIARPMHDEEAIDIGLLVAHPDAEQSDGVYM